MKIDLTMLSGKLLEIAKLADEKAESSSNGIYLDSQQEVSLFMDYAQDAIKNGEVTKEEVNKIFGFEKSTKASESTSVSDEDIKNAYLNILSDDERADVSNKVSNTTNEEFLEMAHNLDTLLIANEITGTGILLNRLPQYDLGKLAEKYQKLEDRYNDVTAQVENWYRNPDAEPIEVEAQKKFEAKAEEILGMPYQDYAAKYPEELEEVAKIPPIIRGVSSIAEIILHEQAVAKLSETGVQVYRAISNLNSALAMDFNSWENDIKYRVNDLTSEMSMDVIMQLSVVSSNEYSDADDFEMPENWLVKKNFKEAVEEFADLTSVNSSQMNSTKKTAVKKIIKDGQVIIEKTNPDGQKEYYDLSGIKLGQ